MPLSKARQAEYMREYRKRTRYNVIPKPDNPVQPEPQFRPNKYADNWQVKVAR